MGTSSSFGQFAAKIQRVEHGMSGRALLDRVAQATKGDPAEAARADADLNRTGTPGAFSNWGKGNIELSARYKVINDDTFEMSPAGRSAGPWRVAEQGVSAASFGPVLKLTKTGKVSQRKRKARRNMGATGGFGTWSEAVALMESRVPKRVDGELVRLLRKEF